MSEKLTLKNAVKQLGLHDDSSIYIVTNKKAVFAKAGNIPDMYTHRKCNNIRKQDDGTFIFTVG